jgi:hypothetical protein
MLGGAGRLESLRHLNLNSNMHLHLDLQQLAPNLNALWLHGDNFTVLSLPEHLNTLGYFAKDSKLENIMKHWMGCSQLRNLTCSAQYETAKQSWMFPKSLVTLMLNGYDLTSSNGPHELPNLRSLRLCLCTTAEPLQTLFCTESLQNFQVSCSYFDATAALAHVIASSHKTLLRLEIEVGLLTDKQAQAIGMCSQLKHCSITTRVRNCILTATNFPASLEVLHLYGFLLIEAHLHDLARCPGLKKLTVAEAKQEDFMPLDFARILPSVTVNRVWKITETFGFVLADAHQDLMCQKLCL